MKRFVLVAALALVACAHAPAQAQCPDTVSGMRVADLKAAGEWEIPNEDARNAFALALAHCLASPDPAVRDGIAYEALHAFLRARQLRVETMVALEADLRARLTAPEGAGFERPFAALVLSEVARADRIEAFLSDAQRAALLDAAIAYFTSVRDYRGFDETEGWRHGVAHGADLLLQLGLNPAFGRAEMLRILDALQTQIAPPGQAWVYGESERIARPVIFMAQRGVLSAEEWSAWCAELVAGDWSDAYTSQAGLARRHNVLAVLSAIYVNVKLSEDANDDALLPGVEAALRALP